MPMRASTPSIAGRAAAAIEALFPGTVVAGTVDRARLAPRVLDDAAALARLEAVVHPMVREDERVFLRLALTRRSPLVVLDVPLLFEAGAAARVDAVAVVTAPAPVQRQRVLARAGMTPAIFASILAKQLPDTDKRARAHFLVDTGSGFPRAQAEVHAIVRALAGRPGRFAASALEELDAVDPA